MASLVVAGDVSGSVTLSAPSAAGSTVITLPTTSGTMVVTGGAQTVQFAAGSAASPSITFTGDTNTGIFSPTADTIAFSEGGVESMRIDASGNLNMSTVGGKVNFATTSSATVNYIGVPADGFSLELACQRGVSQPFVYKLDFANGHIWSTAGSERMRIASDGTVGIGTNSPSQPLTVTGGAGSGMLVFSAGSTAGATIFQTQTQSSNYTWRMAVGGGDNAWVAGRGWFLRDDIAGATRIAVDTSGNVGIGSTSPSSRLHVDGGSGMSSSGVIARFFGTSGNSLLIRGNGNCENTNGSFGAISDAKLKENIVDATPKLDKVTQLKVRNYNLIGDDLKQIGFVAQEIEQVFPSIVSQIPDLDEEGNDLGTTTKTVKTTVLIPILVKAIQELNAKVEAQAAEIAALKGAN